MPELLLELLSEEIPARMQKRASEDLKKVVTDGLMEAGLFYEAAKAFVTPRRLTLFVSGVPAKTEDTVEDRRGPKVGAPEKAVQGFLGSAGLTLDQVEERETDKGAFYFALIERQGRAAADIISDLMPDIVRAFPWPKSQRWGAASTTMESLRWVRPLHSILCILGGEGAEPEIVNLEVGGIKSGNITSGHRFLAPDTFKVSRFEDYVAKLKAAHVVLDPAERREIISQDAMSQCFARGLTLMVDDGLLDEVVGLVEWPVVLMGEVAPEFRDLPPEVLATSMKAHQKFFTVTDTAGMVTNFITVSNLAASDGGKQIIAGNERVLAARLADARFFWDEDRKKTLEQHGVGLDQVTFHAKLGSQSERVNRIAVLAREIAPKVGADPDKAERAALLCKVDLTTEMVGEFPELQGLMGRYYAQLDGEDASIATAIEDHYRPQGPSDAVPTDPVTITVALADKIDMLTGFWAIDEKPTGSKDPFALRRAALGTIRLILENGLRLNLADCAPDPEVGGSLLDFFADRLKVHLREEGIAHDCIDAVFALGAQDDLWLLVEQVRALDVFLKTDDGASLMAGYRRAANIVAAEEKKDGPNVEYSGDVTPDLFDKAEPEEAALYAAVTAAKPAADDAIEVEDFTAAMAAMSALRAPVDAFFDKVMVNADAAAVRRNRLCLLNQIRQTLNAIADFSRIEG